MNMISTSGSKRLPPFGQLAIEYQKEHGEPVNGIWIASGDSNLWGSAWGFAKMCNRLPFRLGMIFPNDLPPEHYLWPVSGAECFVWLSDLPDEIADRLGNTLIKSGAKIVRILQVDYQNRCSLAVYGSKEVGNSA